MAQPEKFVRSEVEQKRCDEIHDTFREDLLKRQLSNNENYDKAILSLSSAGLALSLTAIKFVIPLSDASHLWAIKASWVLFLISIISSLAAYLIGNAAISKQLSIAEDYYLNGLVKAQTQSNIYSTINSIINRITGLIFVFAISLVIYFVTINLNGDTEMSDKESTTTNTSQRVYAKDSASIPRMQTAPGHTGVATSSAEIPKMQLAPGTVAPVEKSASPSGGEQSTKGKSE